MKISSVPTPRKRRICVVLRPGPNRPIDEQRESGHGQQRRADGPVLAEPPRRQLSAFAHGRDRRHSRRAEGGAEAREDRDEDPDENCHDDRPRVQDETVVRQVKPTASNSLKRPTPSPRPTKIPTTEARVPITNASTTIENRTWRRDAPSVRSVASSRVRCAIVIDSVFAITNAPTKSAIAPNASRKYWRKLRKPFVSFVSCFACAWPVLHLRVGGQDRRISATSCAGVTPGFACDADLVELPDSLEEPLRGRQVEHRERRAAEARRAAEVHDAGDRGCGSPARLPETPIVSPTLKSFLRAVAWSIAISFGARPLPVDELERVEASGRRRDRR